MAVNKYEKIYEWLQEYSGLQGFLYFNTSELNDGSASMNSTTGDRRIKEYIDGSYEAALDFGVSFVKMYDTEQSDLNIEAMGIGESFINWIEENADKLSFGDNFIIDEVVSLNNSPMVSCDIQNALAKYQFTARVTYTFLNND